MEQSPPPVNPAPRKRRKKRRPPPKKDWLLPAIGITIGALLLIILGLLARRWIWPENPDTVAADGSAEIAEDIRDYYEGNYALISTESLVKENILPEGIRMAERANQLQSEWGNVTIMGTNAQGRTQPPYSHFLISYESIPSQVCTTFVPVLMARYQRVWIGQSALIPLEADRVSDASQITARCSAAPTLSILALGQ